MKNINKKHLFWMILSLVFAIVLLVLECLPNGVEMVFGFPDADTDNIVYKYEYYPYFSGMPYGYGNIAPMFICIFTLATIILCIVNIFVDKKGIDVTIVVLSALRIIFSGFEFIFSKTPINWTVFSLSIAFTICDIAMLILNKKTQKSAPPQSDEHPVADTQND